LDIFSGDISPQVFKLVVRNEPGEVSLDKKMLRVIALVDEPIQCLKGDFFVYPTGQLSMATGPMAEVLIEDAVASLGYDRSSFPKITYKISMSFSPVKFLGRKRGRFLN
jgi:hypothetical protein